MYKLLSATYLTTTIFVLIFILSTSINTTTILNLLGTNMNDNSDLTEIKYPSVFDLKIEDKAWIESTLERMTLEEKCSQMIMPWVLGNYSSFDSKEFQRIKNLVENKKVGGLIFFKGDILNEAMIINQMQEISDIPLLIASDFERGLAMRLTDAAEFP